MRKHSPVLGRRYAVTIPVAALLFVSSGCGQNSLIPPFPSSAPSAPSGSTTYLTAIEADIHNRVNRHRISIGLPPLTLHPILSELAREHSEKMAAGSAPFGHDGFEERFAVAQETVLAYRLSENVATNFNFPRPAVSARAVSGWIESPGHRQNLEGPFEVTGVGVARSSRGEYYATQLYAALTDRP